jgi:hypothetical protein
LKRCPLDRGSDETKKEKRELNQCNSNEGITSLLDESERFEGMNESTRLQEGRNRKKQSSMPHERSFYMKFGS